MSGIQAVGNPMSRMDPARFFPQALSMAAGGRRAIGKGSAQNEYNIPGQQLPVPVSLTGRD